MADVGWFFAGAIAVLLAAFVALLIVDSDLRRAAGQTALALLCGPALLVVAFVRRGPRLVRVSPRALERFSLLQGPDGLAAWLLAYGGRGIMFVRRRQGYDWHNNLPNRADDTMSDSGIATDMVSVADTVSTYNEAGGKL